MRALVFAAALLLALAADHGAAAIQKEQKQHQEQQQGHYVVSGVNRSSPLRWEARLDWTGPSPKSADEFGDVLTPLRLEVRNGDDDAGAHLRVKITDLGGSRWEIPYTPLGEAVASSTALSPGAASGGRGRSAKSAAAGGSQDQQTEVLLSPGGAPLLRVELSPVGAPFALAVVRKSDGMALFNTSLMAPLVLYDAFLSLETSVPSRAGAALFGLGTHTREMRLVDGTYVMFNKGNNGIPQNKNLYGSHPFMLHLGLPSGAAHGVLLFNSNAQEVVVDQERGRWAWTSIGGIVDLNFFAGPSPAEVLRQYHAAIGLPHLPPYWALGFHQCRYGYFSLLATREVVEGYRAANIPLETMWNDIDHMHWMRDFTFDPVLFPVDGPNGMRAFVDELHRNGQHYVVILDPGIASETKGWSYPPYERLLETGAVVMQADGKEPLWNVVWPGYTVFPDFSDAAAVQIWGEFIRDFSSSNASTGLLGVPVDGLWIDMNEPRTFCNGQCYPSPATRENALKLMPSPRLRPGTPRLKFDPDNPPFVPGGTPLADGTVSLSGLTKVGGLMYNSHDLYGFLEQRATQLGLEKARQKRSLVISRSTFVGSGHHGGHWLGDNDSSWSDLFFSIPGMLRFQFYGVPLVGSDICGFMGETTEELCTRWIQLGSFYPFCRDHNSIFEKSQELYALGPVVANVSRFVLNQRYRMLPYFYSLFFRVHSEGGTVVRPLWVEWNTDAVAVNIDHQFMLGSGLLISPVLAEKQISVKAYFPPSARWFDWYTGAAQSSGWQDLPAPIEHINVHMRGGVIIPNQASSYVLRDARLLPFTLHAALDHAGSAEGELFWDDGEKLETLETGKFTHITFTAHNRTVSNQIQRDGYAPAHQRIVEGFRVLGLVDASVSVVSLNSAALPRSSWSFSGGVLAVKGLTLPLCKPFQLIWA